MQIEIENHEELVVLAISGSLDNDSSVYLQDAIDEVVREGVHRIIVDLKAITYLSSAGIGALLATKKQLDRLDGFFGVYSPADDVERVLRQTRVFDQLICDPDVVRSEVPIGSMTLQSKTFVQSRDGIDLKGYYLGDENRLRAAVFGTTEPLFFGNFDQQHCQTVEFAADAFGLGLGSLGNDFDSVRERCGEFLSVAGAIAQSPQSSRGLPDYSLSMEDYKPTVQVLYGLQFQGAFSRQFRFWPSVGTEPFPLSRLVGLGLDHLECRTAGVVLFAECAGIVGTQLRQSPAQALASQVDSGERFAYPHIRDWLSFSAERIHCHSTVVIVGVVQRSGGQEESGKASSGESRSTLDAFLRPFDEAGSLVGHFHAAVFPYRPLQRRSLKLQSSVIELFKSGGIVDVVHLLRDDRPISGAGETELTNGTCWMAPLTDVRNLGRPA